MAKSRAAKNQEHDTLVDRLGRAASVVFIGYSGLTVKDVTELRSKLRAAGAELVATKKTVLRRALASSNYPADDVDALTGEVALAFGFEDEISPAKVLAAFAKDHQALLFKGAIVNNAFVSADAAKALAKLPARDELRAKLVYVIGSPINGMVNVLAGTLRGFVQVLSARQEKLSSAS